MPSIAAHPDLFAGLGAEPKPNQAPILPDGVFLKAGVLDRLTQAALVAAVRHIGAEAPFRHPRVKGKGSFSAAITNAGTVGWWSDSKGYRYLPTQPDAGDGLAGRPWPALPPVFLAAVDLAVAGTPWAGFVPDACLINFYGPRAKMGLHQDRDERDFSQPIVTVCLGDDADFLVGGPKRADRAQAMRVKSGDVLLMGGASRMLFHGIRRIHPGTSPLPETAGRYSLTFRKAL